MEEECSGECSKECTICLLQYTEKTKKTTECHHIFHQECIDRWLENNNNCPLCRTCLQQHIMSNTYEVIPYTSYGEFLEFSPIMQRVNVSLYLMHHMQLAARRAQQLSDDAFVLNQLLEIRPVPVPVPVPVPLYLNQRSNPKLKQKHSDSPSKRTKIKRSRQPNCCRR